MTKISKNIKKDIIDKAEKIITSLKEGKSYHDFKGKKFSSNRNVISIPIDNDYRILMFKRKEGNTFKVLSHEQYNMKKYLRALY